MIIHSSHTRKDICEIIEIFDLIDYIEDYSDLSKKDLVKDFTEVLNKIKKLTRDDKFIFGLILSKISYFILKMDLC